VRIGELAAATGASTRSLRYYEQQGLLASQRSTSGQRHYPETAVERDDLIKCLLEAGLSSSTIFDVLPCIADETIRTPWLEQRLHDELRRVDEQLGSLNATRMVLTEVIAPVSRIAKDARRDPPGVSRTFSPTRISRPAGRTADARPPPEGSRCRPKGRREAQDVPSRCAVGGDVVGARYGFRGWPMT